FPRPGGARVDTVARETGAREWPAQVQEIRSRRRAGAAPDHGRRTGGGWSHGGWQKTKRRAGGAAVPKVPPISDSGRLPGGHGLLHHWRHGSLSAADPILASPLSPVPSMAQPGNKKTIRTAGAPGPSKLQRWLDVLAALLSHRYPITLEQLRREVP